MRRIQHTGLLAMETGIYSRISSGSQSQRIPDWTCLSNFINFQLKLAVDGAHVSLLKLLCSYLGKLRLYPVFAVRLFREAMNLLPIPIPGNQSKDGFETPKSQRSTRTRNYPDSSLQRRILEFISRWIYKVNIES